MPHFLKQSGTSSFNSQWGLKRTKGSIWFIFNTKKRIKYHFARITSSSLVESSSESKGDCGKIWCFPNQLAHLMWSISKLDP